MLKWSLTAIAAIVVVFLAVVALQPSDFKVERSATMRAPAPAAFAQVNDFQNWARGRRGRRSTRRSSASTTVPRQEPARFMRGRATRTSAKAA